MKKAGLAVLIAFICFLERAHSQGQAGSKLGPAYQAYIDSIKSRPYNWTFPIWGKRLSKRGFDLPLAAGIMLNPYIGSQKILISDLKVGLNGSELVPLDFIKFGTVKANIQSITVRPDLWVLPFLDVYAIAGATWSQTSVELKQPVQFTTTANFFGSTFGVGTTLAGGIHGFVTIIDINHTWSSIKEIKGSIQASMFTPRLGYNFRFKNKPQQNITLWVGAPGIFINRVTEGTIDVGSLSSDAGKSTLISATDGSQQWYQDLTPAQKKIVKAIGDKWIEKIDGGGGKDLSISYSLIKKPVSNWSMCIGGQVQINHRWQLRTEAGFLGGRESLLLSGNFRFGL
jgi:hypothetical protein